MGTDVHSTSTECLAEQAASARERVGMKLLPEVKLGADFTSPAYLGLKNYIPLMLVG